jgi:hypothetical protein
MAVARTYYKALHTDSYKVYLTKRQVLNFGSDKRHSVFAVFKNTDCLRGAKTTDHIPERFVPMLALITIVLLWCIKLGF